MGDEPTENDIRISTSSPVASSNVSDAPFSLCRATIEAYKDSRARQKQKLYESLRREERAHYRLERQKKGLLVRPHRFHDHEPRQPQEDSNAYKARLHRDGQRARRGVTAETVRPWTDLSQMTLEQRKEHSRALATNRQREKRSKERAAQIAAVEGGLSSEELAAILALLDL